MVYFIEAVGYDRIKIGTTDNIEARLVNLAAGSPIPFEFRLLGVIPGGVEVERRTWRKYPEPRLYGEWFAFTSIGREWLSKQRIYDLETVRANLTVDKHGDEWFWPPIPPTPQAAAPETVAKKQPARKPRKR